MLRNTLGQLETLFAKCRALGLSCRNVEAGNLDRPKPLFNNFIAAVHIIAAVDMYFIAAPQFMAMN
jgi:hypothetical protein